MALNPAITKPFFVDVTAYTDLSAARPTPSTHIVQSAAICNIHIRTDWRWDANSPNYGKPVAIVRMLVTGGTIDSSRDVNRVGPAVIYVVGTAHIKRLCEALVGPLEWVS